jgi:hypothetical protein
MQVRETSCKCSFKEISTTDADNNNNTVNSKVFALMEVRSTTV